MGYGFKMGGRGIILKDPKLKLSVGSLSISGAEMTKTFSIDWNGDGVPEVSSSDPNVATVVLNGQVATVTYVSQGSAIITVAIRQTKHYLSDEIALSVTCTRSNASITLSDTSLNISGSSGSGTFTIESSTSDGAISVASSKPGVAEAAKMNMSVVVTYITEGSSEITVSTPQTRRYNAASATCSVRCSKSASTLTLSNSTLAIAGATGSGSFTFTYNGDGTISVSSSDPSVAEVSYSGKTVFVTYVKQGSATITVSLSDGIKYSGISKTCSVTTVRSNRSLTVSKSSVALSGPSPSTTLVVTFTGDDLLNYASTNNDVATVSVNQRTSQSTVTIRRAGNGSCTINFSLPETAKWNAANAYCGVTCSQGSVVWYVEGKNWGTWKFTTPWNTSFSSLTPVYVRPYMIYAASAKGREGMAGDACCAYIVFPYDDKVAIRIRDENSGIWASDTSLGLRFSSYSGSAVTQSYAPTNGAKYYAA